MKFNLRNAIFKISHKYCDTFVNHLINVLLEKLIFLSIYLSV